MVAPLRLGLSVPRVQVLMGTSGFSRSHAHILGKETLGRPSAGQALTVREEAGLRKVPVLWFQPP